MHLNKVNFALVTIVFFSYNNSKKGIFDMQLIPVKNNFDTYCIGKQDMLAAFVQIYSISEFWMFAYTKYGCR